MDRKSDLDNHADQLNPNNDAYWDGRGYDGRPDDWEELVNEDEHEISQADLDNHADQLNPNSDTYSKSRSG